MNNDNFGIDYRNNIGNCQFETIYDEINEIAYIKKICKIFDNEQYKNFACPETMKEKMKDTFNRKLLALDPNDPIFEARKNSVYREKAESLHAVESMIASKEKTGKNLRFLTLNKRLKTV